MKQILLSGLVMENFKAQSRTVSFSRGTTEISGRNGSGKSTVFDAIMWCLTGYDCSDRQNFKLYDDRLELTKENAVTASVTLTLLVDGQQTEFRRTATQKWVRERGSEEYTKASSDEYKTYIDGLEYPATKYQEAVGEIFGQYGKIKLMINPEYWLMLDWRVLRKHFQDIVGEVTGKDFSGDYSAIADDLKTKTPDEVKKYYHDKAYKKHTEKQIREGEFSYSEKLDALRAEYNATKVMIPDLQACEEAEKEIQTLQNERTEIDVKLASVKSTEEVGYKIRRLEADMAEAQRQYENKTSAAFEAIRQEYNNAKRNNENVEATKKTLMQRIGNLSELLQSYGTQREEKLAELKNIKEASFSGKCPCCGAELKGDTKSKAFEKWQKSVKENYNACVEQGKRIKTQIENTEVELKKAEEEYKELKRIDLEPIVKRGKAAKERTPAWEVTDEYKKMQAGMDELKSQFNGDKSTEYAKRKCEIDARLQELFEITALKRQADNAKARMAEIKAEGQTYAKMLAECEQKEMLAEKYIEEGAEIVRQRLGKFLPGEIQVEMQKQKKDGSYEPSCGVMYKGTAVQTLNTEKRRNVSLAVMRAFRQFYDVDTFTLVDNANDFDSEHLPKIEGQAVLAFVRDSEFKVSTENNEKQ